MVAFLQTALFSGVGNGARNSLESRGSSREEAALGALGIVQ